MTKLIFFAIFFACSTLTNNPALAQTIIYGGTLIDLSGNGQNSQDIDNSYVIFEGNRIIETGIYTKQFVFPENAKRIDATGKYILPGLIDGFAALNNQSYANAYLYSGVTTIIAVDGGRRGAFFGDADPGPDYLRLESVGDDKKNDRGHLDDLEYLNEKGYEIALLKYELRPGQLKICNDEAHSLRMGTIGELGFTSYKEGCAIGIDAFVHTTRYSLDVAPEEMRLAVAQEPFSDDLNSSKWKYYQYLFNLDTSNKALKKHALVLAASDVFLMPTLSLLYLDLPDSKNPWLDPVSTIL
ncbi:MAG: hypothetical protein KAG99_02465, partial [Bacteroidales bacterium]|nr:hypothetical protein [Bacteroidales bacterium]